MKDVIKQAERERFLEIRTEFCEKVPLVAPGKMMSSEAITYEGKVFAFFSRKQKMVFKLGKQFDPETQDFEIRVFNPFTKRAPLYGWFEVPYTHQDQWEPLAEKALQTLTTEG
ncbi:MAG: hypothetical protein ACFB10_21555 [Salibacteraceae bacterium]